MGARDMARVLFNIAIGVAIGIIFERSRRQSKAKTSKGHASSSSDVVKSGKDVFVDRSQLVATVAACLEKHGTPADKAGLVADVLVAADCRGIPSHGVNRAEMYCGELKAKLIEPEAEPVIAAQTCSTANIDGRNGFGAVVSKFAMELCIKKAKSTGIGFVVCHHSNHFGIAGYWPELALKEGLIAFAFTNTSPWLVPTRSVSRAGGTNPIAFYCPAGDGDSFQLDMATSTVPVGKIEVCHRKGQQLPFGWGVDKHGNATADPSEVMKSGGVTPLGGMEESAGYKGYGLNMMVEILCAVLSGCGKVGPDVPPWRCDRGIPADYGHCFVCIDPERFVEDGKPCQFQPTLEAYLTRMRGLQSAKADLAVLVPGDPEKTEEAVMRTRGVRLNEHVANGLRNLARECGCAEILPETIKQLPENVVPKHILA